MSVYLQAITREVRSVSADGTLLTHVSALEDVEADDGRWFWSGGTLYVSPPGDVDPDTLTWRVMAGETYRVSMVGLPDRRNYYGGQKFARVVAWHDIFRGASGDEGDVQGVTFGFEWADYPDAVGQRLLSGLLASAGQHFLIGRTVIIYTVSDADRRLAYDTNDDGTLYPARVLARGVIASLKPNGFVFTVNCQDEFTYRYGPQRRQDQIPKRRRSRDFRPDLPEELINTPEPFWYGRLTDAGVGNAPTDLTAVAQAQAAAPLGSFTATIEAGGSGALATAFYCVVDLDGDESQLSEVLRVDLTDEANRRVRLQWATPAGRPVLFRSHRSDFAQFEYLIFSPGTTEYVDDFLGRDDPPASPWYHQLGSRINVGVAVWAKFADGTWSRPAAVRVDTRTNGASRGQGYFAPLVRFVDDDPTRVIESTWVPPVGAVEQKWMFWRSFGTDQNEFFDFAVSLPGDATSYSYTMPTSRVGRIALETPNQTERIRGIVPLKPVGERVIGEKRYRILEAAGHALASPGIFDIYVSTAIDQTQLSGFEEDLGSVETFERVPDSDFGEDLDWRAPGKPDGVPEASGYIDRTAPDGRVRRYTEVYCALDPLPDQIFADMMGAEDVGDGTGDPIVDLPSQYAHCYDNYLEGDYQSGNYPTDVPRYDDGMPKRDVARFALATLRGLSKFPPDGLTAAWGVGSAGFEAVLNLMASLHRSGALDGFWTKDLAWAIHLFLPDDIDAAPIYTDHRDIFEGFAGELREDELYTLVPYRLRRHWGTGEYEVSDVVRTQAAIDGYGDGTIESTSPERDFGALRSEGKAQQIAEDYALLHERPPAGATFPVGWRGLADELCSLLKVTHRQGPTGATGWSLTPVELRAKRTQPMNFSEQFTVRDVSRLVDEFEDAAPYLTTEAGYPILTEDGRRILVEAA